MTFDELMALTIFAFVSSITPGPNNLMLLSSGVNFGAVRTIPHALGIAAGFFSLLMGVGSGLIELFERYPFIQITLKGLCVIYMFWLAWKIANSARPEAIEEGGGETRAKPFSFLQAALFQWINPKAWAMAISAYTVYAPSLDVGIVLIVAITFTLVNLPSVSTWIFLGMNLQRFLSTEKVLRRFNILMALLLLVSLYPVLK